MTPRAKRGARTKRAHEPRWERQLPDERRRALIDATIRSLKKHGHEGLSVRRIAAHADVAIGLINHHFPNKNALVAESYRHFNQQLIEGFRAAVERAPAHPRARLRAFIEATFSRPNLDPDVLNAWIVYWSLFRHSPEIQKVHDDAHSGYGELLHDLLADLARDGGRLRLDLRLAVVGLTAMLDGLWLEYCLNPRRFKPHDAIQLCESWIDSLSAR